MGGLACLRGGRQREIDNVSTGILDLEAGKPGGDLDSLEKAPVQG